MCACIALVMEVILPYRKSKVTAYFALVGIASCRRSLWECNAGLPTTLCRLIGFYGMVRIDGFALLFKAIFLIAAALAIAISTRYLDIEGEQHGEYYALVLFATVGMMFLGLWLRSDLALHQSGVDGADVLRARRFHQTRKAFERSGDEVFSAGRFFVRRLALRHVVALRRRRLNQPRRDRTAVAEIAVRAASSD